MHSKRIRDTKYTSPYGLDKWRRALNNVRTNSGRARILCIGDSTTAGLWSNGLGTGDEFTNSYPSQLSNLLTASGIASVANSFMGFPSAASSRNPNYVFGSSWAVSPSTSIGGGVAQANTTTNGIDFTPPNAVDTFFIWYIVQTGNTGVLSYAINGGSTTTFNANATTNLARVGPISCVLGTNTISIKYVSGNSVLVAGIEAYDSTTNAVDVINAGWGGATSTQMSDATGAYSPKFVNNLSPDLTIFSMGINDWDAASSIATLKTNLQTLITQAKLTGSVLLWTPPPSNPGASAAPANSVQQPYAQMFPQLASSNNIPVVDIFGKFISYANSNALGLMGDGLHPNGSGYAQIAKNIFNVIRNV